MRRRTLSKSGIPLLRGLVLAGGRSARMGTDKAALVLSGETLLARTVSLLGTFTPSVHVGIRADQAGDLLRGQFSVLFDVPSTAGPAAAMVAAFTYDPDAAWWVLACDMPALAQSALAALFSARDSTRAATAWRNPVDGLPEPLCAIWEPATLAHLALKVQLAGNLAVSPRSLLLDADVVLLDTAHPETLRSLNTPADLHGYMEQKDG